MFHEGIQNANPRNRHFSSASIHLCGSSHGFLAGYRRQRPRGYPRLHPCSAGSRFEGWSSSPGCPSLLQCCSYHGIPEPQLPWPWTPSPSAGGTVQLQPGLLLWPASASGSFLFSKEVVNRQEEEEAETEMVNSNHKQWQKFEDTVSRDTCREEGERELRANQWYRFLPPVLD